MDFSKDDFPVTHDEAVIQSSGNEPINWFPFINDVKDISTEDLVAELVRRRREGEKVNEAIRQAELDA